MANLREEIFNLTNPAPKFRDPEDEVDEDTTAKLVSYDSDNGEGITQPSKLRQKTALLLSDSDRKYAGKRTSRKDLDEDSDESAEEGSGTDGDVDSIEDNDESEEDEISDFNKKFSQVTAQEFTFEDDGDYGKYADSDDEYDNDDDSDYDDDDIGGSGDKNMEGDDSGDGVTDDDGEEEDEDQDDGDDDEDEGGEEENSEDEGIQKFSSSVTDDVAKGQAARQQLGLWDSLLEGRIKLQKAVALVNQLPQMETWIDFQKSSSQFAEEATKTQQVFQHLLESLVYLQDLLLFQNKETKTLLDDQPKDSSGKKAPPTVDDDDEEIPSDSEEEMETETKSDGLRPGKRKLKMEDYPGFLKKRHGDFHSYRNTTIQKWYDKTRLATGNIKGKSFSAFDQSSIAQINQILSDRERLVRRTQLKRSVYRVLGTAPKLDQPEIVPSEETETQTPAAAGVNLKDYDEEIFDDDDFYHQMLRELIEKKTTDINDPVALSRQWLEIQKLRSKNKKKVDTKASKGRKVRYDVHKKLVNFMAPVDSCEWSHEARDDLFKSLFGKRFSNGTGV